MYDDSNVVAFPDRNEGALFIRDVVGVVFRPGTPVGDRQAAIDRVSGTVIGGMRPQNGEGVYYVRLPHDSANPRVFDAVRTLRSTPSVLTAVPGMVLINPFPAAEPKSQEPHWPLLIDSFPRLDTARLVQLPSGRLLYRANITLRFKVRVSDSAKVAFFKRHRMTVVGVTRSGRFFIGVPDRGPSLDSLFRMLELLNEEPEILVAASLGFSPLEPALDSRSHATVVTGIVLDSAGAHPVYPSRVDLLGGAVFALGDTEGRFALSPVSVGRHVLTVRGIGFFPTAVSIVATGDTLQLGAIRLRPNPKSDSVNLIAP